MNKKISKKNLLVGFGLFCAAVIAMYPTSSFISKGYTIDTNMKQQNYNWAGLFTITPFDAAKYYYDNPSDCYWVDVRDTAEFHKAHLKPAVNFSLKQLKNIDWKPEDLILVYSTDTGNAQDIVAFLRQVKNAQAFAVEGGFKDINKFLIQPINLSILSQMDDQKLQELVNYRSKLSNQQIPAQSLDELKSTKTKAIREGC